MNKLPRRHCLGTLATGSAVIAIASIASGVGATPTAKPSRLFLAPMIGVVDTCILTPNPAPGARVDALTKSCTGPDGSASALIESTLSALAGAGSGTLRYPLGYTLPVPLLKLFRKSGADWAIDQVAVDRLVRTIRDNDRPALIYLFSTHFGVNAPIEQALGADIRNLSETPKGPLLRDKYYSIDIFNWTFASTATGITQRRMEAAKAVVAGICKLEPRQIAKIQGVTLLGELHHVFPGFERGMSFDAPYLVSDYSETSKLGFRAYLKKKFIAIENLNTVLGTQWSSFEQIDPPSKDIRTTPLRQYTEHIDSFAHGKLPVSGWVYVKAPRNQEAQTIRIYRDGELIGKTQVNLGRQDVLQAHPEFGDANTGWRFDLDFKSLPPGIHRIDAYLEDGKRGLMHLSSRQVAIMNRLQQTPGLVPQKPLPFSATVDETINASVDLPLDQSSYFYNPLVPLWHAFRGQQVVDYLEFFSGVVKGTCLANTNLYTHQIFPYTNPSWDENKYAIDASLAKLNGIRLGVSLYGEPTYGASFSRWLKASGHTHYGITEFHPMKAMSPAEMEKLLKLHSAQGAEFISFFLEPRWKGALVARGHNIFSLDPENPRFGSDVLYRSTREALESRQ